MSTSPTADPIQKLPSPGEIRAHIGQLLRELRIARRLLKLVQSTAADRLPRPTGEAGEGAEYVA
jgi:hypothetical protein